ncbi:MAG TPA: nitroreductase family protein, partial [Geminicoccaceae bacterium]|nr:nitroreductase family protein [Geminicoccaceae bacterium]
MNALDAVLTRQSVAPAFLREPAPDDAALESIFAAAASAPDHGRLRPWRFILIRGPARVRLGGVFAQALLKRQPDAPEAALEQERARPMRAPLLIAVAAKVDPQHAKIPEIEQILS